jgi:Fe-S cluster assembly protein SufD
MTTLAEPTGALLESAPTTAPDLPGWFAERQRAAWQRFLEIPAPTRRDETWRFSSIKQLDFSAFTTTDDLPADTAALIERSKGVEKPLAKFIFANETLIEIDASLPDEVICLPLAEALVLHPDLVQEHFMQQETRLGSAKWAALHEARVTNGLFVYVPEGFKVEGTIEVHHWLSGDHTAIFPHTLIVTGAGAEVRVVDTFRSVNDTDAGLCIAVNDLVAGPDSKLDYVVLQAFNENTKVVSVNDTGVAKGAATTGFILNTGASWARNESLCRLEGEESRSDMLSVSVPARQQEYDQRTFQHHVSPGAFSDLLYKNSLYDKSRTIFSGLIFVDEGAHRTDAYQTCRNLFMSADAESNSMPGLEINADDVKCSHGSTSAEISEEEIFYLRARGIDPVRARQLIARGFSVEAIEKIGDSQVEDLVLRYLDDKFAQIAGGGA